MLTRKLITEDFLMTLSIKNGRKVAKSKSFLISFLVMFRLRLWLKKKWEKKRDLLLYQ